MANRVFGNRSRRSLAVSLLGLAIAALAACGQNLDNGTSTHTVLGDVRADYGFDGGGLQFVLFSRSDPKRHKMSGGTKRSGGIVHFGSFQSGDGLRFDFQSDTRLQRMTLNGKTYALDAGRAFVIWLEGGTVRVEQYPTPASSVVPAAESIEPPAFHPLIERIAESIPRLKKP